MSSGRWEKQQREEVFVSPQPHSLGLPALKVKTPFNSCKVVLLSTLNSRPQKLETVKSSVTNMLPLTPFDTSCKLNLKSNRQAWDKVPGQRFTHTIRGGSWAWWGLWQGGPGSSWKWQRAPCLPQGLLPSLDRGIAPGSARLTVLNHQAFRGQTGRGLEQNTDLALAGGSRTAQVAPPTQVSKAKSDSRLFKERSCKDPVRSKAARNGETKVPLRDQRKTSC